MKRYYTKAIKILKKLGFAGGNLNLMIDDVKAIDDVITILKENGLVMKIMEGLWDYLS